VRFKSIIVGIFFGLIVIVGLLIHRDYGIPWDESIQRNLGTDVYKYVMGIDEDLFKNKDRLYGTAYELFLVFLETGDQDVKEVYHMRHLVNFLLFAAGVFFFYLLLVKRFRSVWWGLLGSLMLILSPRIFAHSFYNTKDIAFMSMFIIAAYFAVIFAENKNGWFALVAALATAVLIDIRVMGVLLPILLVDIFFINGYREKDEKYFIRYILLLIVFVVAFWPSLWRCPVTNFIKSFDYYPQNTSTMYFGERVKSLAVPWHYTLGWISVTTPISYLALSLFGLAFFIGFIPKTTREDLLMLGWLLVPLVITILFKSVLSDAWRHMFFIYPPVLYFAVFALAKASPRIRRIFLILLCINLYFVIQFMVRQHPYQNLYFNEFVSPPYEKKFELDYWGVAYKEGYEYIAKVDKRPLIKVAFENLPGENNLMLLDAEDRQRFEVVDDVASADYYLTNYRKYKNMYYESALYTVDVSGTRILGVHKLK
jgi:hypothetical protein